MSYIQRFSAKGIYGRFDLTHKFEDGINIVYGRNGVGKSTMLHIIANLLNEDYERFAYLIFDSLHLELSDGKTIEVYRKNENERVLVYVFEDKIEKFKFEVEETIATHKNEDQERARWERTKTISKVAYFPAFRTMIEAWGTNPMVRNQEYRESWPAEFRHPWSQSPIDRIMRTTHLARKLFGEFIPKINYSSLLEIEARLSEEIYRAKIKMAEVDSKLLSQAFLRIFQELTTPKSREKVSNDRPDKILEDIRALSEKPGDSTLFGEFSKMVQSYQVSNDDELSAVPILDVYRDSLISRNQEKKESFAMIERYFSAVNQFLEGKKIDILENNARRFLQVKLTFNDGTLSSLRTLSSGEREIVTLLYAATHMSSQKVVLIDEPEISLHLDWQRDLLSKMSEQMGQRQIIACTHSPSIAGEYIDKMRELEMTPVKETHQIEPDETDVCDSEED